MELLLVERIKKVLQRFTLPLSDSKELGVRLRLVEHAYELADELLAELFDITD